MPRTYQALAKAATVLALLLGSNAGVAGTLFVGADTEEFGGLINGQDRIAKVTTTGATAGPVQIIPLGFLPGGAPVLANGLADGGGFLFAGTPQLNQFHRLNFNGGLISSINAPGIPNTGCCNEEMIFDTNGNFYHVHFADVIRQINPVTGAQIGIPFPQTDVVGMALIGTEIWISKWGGRSIGTWDPATNTYTQMADLNGVGQGTNVGALAYDPFDDILWVGRQEGWVEAYDFSTLTLIDGSAFQPFGAMPDTIDGLAFLGEVTVPEPATLALLGIALAGLGFSRRRKLH
jgi:hypothetical protein